MVAFSGADPIGVLIGAKRASGTLVHRIAVHPDHRRQGHGRHLLESLGAKLAILGPSRIVAEVPQTLASACELFGTLGFVREAVLVDYVLEREVPVAREVGGRFVIPVTVDDLAANALLDGAGRRKCWTRSAETLAARKDEIAGFAVASDDRLEAWLLYVRCGAEIDIVSFCSVVADGGARLALLLSRIPTQGAWTLRLQKVHPDEIPGELMEELGFRAIGGHLLYATSARAARGRAAGA
jgi:hypothetical protein